MGLSNNILRVIESLRCAWPAGRTVDALARELDVQPWRVASLLAQAEQLDLPIESSPAGHTLDPTRGPLLADLVEFGLSVLRVGRSVLVFDEVSSTNDICWQAARPRSGAPADGLVVAAQSQTAGRGRLGRSWSSQPGENLLFSLLLTDVASWQGLANYLAMATCVSLVQGIEDFTDVSPAIRWPNDLYVHSRKLAGILVESRSARVPRATDVVVGIGLNCNQLRRDFPPAVRERATSLADETGHRTDRVGLLRCLLARLDEWLARPTPDEGPRLHSAYVHRMDSHACRVRISHNGQAFDATVRDVDPASGLIVQLDHGGIAHFQPASTSIEWLA